MDFFKYKTKLVPKAGRILVSEPYLPDPNFERTVILMTEHNHEGSIGFILNKPADNLVGDLMEDLKNYKGPLFIGGPVQQDTLHIIHRKEDIQNSVKIAEGVYWGGNFEDIVIRLETNQLHASDIKFFLGYSGWSPGQLEEELNVDSWIVTEHVNEELVFETTYDQMWRKALKDLGGRYSVFSNYPADPRMN
jgi:Putative transcriptional regulator